MILTDPITMCAKGILWNPYKSIATFISKATKRATTYMKKLALIQYDNFFSGLNILKSWYNRYI